jgi:hypothetical protein
MLEMLIMKIVEISLISPEIGGGKQRNDACGRMNVGGILGE